jgi:hypothetical protein
MKIITTILKNKIAQAFMDAEGDVSGLTDRERELYGYSGVRTRNLINNLCDIKNDLTYLELGCYRGATLIAATFRNKITAYAVDDFTIDTKEGKPYKETGWSNPRLALDDLMGRYLSRDCKDSRVQLINSPAMKVNLDTINMPIDIVHYDLDLHHADINDCLTYFAPVLDKHFVLVISNWNSSGLKDSYQRLLDNDMFEVEIVYSKDNGHTADTENWYNGVALATVKKVK